MFATYLAHREGWEKFAVCGKENSQRGGETMTQNIRSLSYQLWSHTSAA